MRLLWLIDSLTAGGAEALTARFAAAVAGDGGDLEPTVAFLRSIGGNRFEDELRATGVHVVGLGARHLRDVAAFRRLRRLVGGCDLVHAHLASASIWGCLAGRLERRPVVTSLHVRPPQAPPWSRERWRRRLRVALANRWAARVVAVSAAVGDAWVAEARLSPRRLAVVHNGVDLPPPSPGARSRVRAELGIGDGAPLVLAVAVLRPGKGIGLLLDAVPGVLRTRPEARFVVAGDGELRAALAARAADAGLAGAVTFTGFRSDVADLLAAADLLALPSRGDAFPTVLLEAMAAGLPVVGVRSGGVPEIVVDGETGVLVEPGDATALAYTLAGLAADPVRRRRLGEAGRRRHGERFTVAAWLGRLAALYGEVLGRPLSPGAAPSARGEAAR